MKKMLIFLIVACVISCFSSCSTSESKSNQAETPENVQDCAEHDYTSSVIREASYDSAGEMKFICKKCDYSYTQSIEQLTKHTVSDSVLNKVLSDMRYEISAQFSIPMSELINYSIDDYKLQYYSIDEALSLGYLNEGDIAETADEDNKDMVYIAVVSGHTKINPEIPYMTEYEDRALIAYMQFDETDNLIDYGYRACQNLQNCALIMFSSSF